MDPNISLKNIIDNADINLASKLSGYTDKKFLKVLAEQVSPNAISENVIIPDEDYELVVTKTNSCCSCSIQWCYCTKNKQWICNLWLQYN